MKLFNEVAMFKTIRKQLFPVNLILGYEKENFGRGIKELLSCVFNIEINFE